MKTNVLFYDSLFSIGNLLYQIVRFGMTSDIKCYRNKSFFWFFCSSLGWQLYTEHYEREFPSLFLNRSHLGGTHTTKEEDDQEEMDEGHVTTPGGVAIPLHPPSLVHWLHQKLTGKQVRKRRERGNKNHAPTTFSSASTFPCVTSCVQENSHFIKGIFMICTLTMSCSTHFMCISLLFSQSYSLFASGDADKPLDLTSCLQVVGGSGLVDSAHFCSLATEITSANPYEKVVLNLVQDGKSYQFRRS